jgi:L-fucose mutarotase/ribose pyranase (RbsD/FucU family)
MSKRKLKDEEYIYIMKAILYILDLDMKIDNFIYSNMEVKIPIDVNKNIEHSIVRKYDSSISFESNVNIIARQKLKKLKKKHQAIDAIRKKVINLIEKRKIKQLT